MTECVMVRGIATLVGEPAVLIALFGLASSPLVRTASRGRPGRHLEVSRRLRHPLKVAFDRTGVEIPFAPREVILRDERA